MKIKKKILAILLLILVIQTPSLKIVWGPHNHDAIQIKTNKNVIDGGWVEERDGIKILHISGSNYEMGYQHGYLLRNETQQDLRAFLNDASLPYEKLLEMWNATKEYIPDEYIQELHGLADGAGVEFEKVATAYTAVMTLDLGCFGISAWGNATKDGKLYHFRSFDLGMNIQDPVTGRYAHDNSVLIVRKPKDGYSSISPSVAGSLSGGGGFNERGIAVGIHTCWSNDQTVHGIPAMIRIQMVLDHASSAEEAINYLTTNSTLGWSFIVSDANAPAGYAVEVTANHSYVGTYDNPVESTPPFWAIDHVVRRTNFFISPELAATQRMHYDPSGLGGFLRVLTDGEPYFVIWNSYRAMSNLLEKNLGNMELNNSMEMFKKGYRGDTDIILKILIKLAEGTSFNRAWNMWVSCPETGDIVVSFAERDKIAFDTPTHYFNLYRLLNEEPP